jgi:hypothetical protein
MRAHFESNADAINAVKKPHSYHTEHVLMEPHTRLSGLIQSQTHKLMHANRACRHPIFRSFSEIRIERRRFEASVIENRKSHSHHSCIASLDHMLVHIEFDMCVLFYP